MADLIELLQPWMFSLDNKIRVEREFIIAETRAAGLAKMKDLEDTLFWSVFAAHHGAEEFVDIETKYKNREIADKEKIAAAAMAEYNAFKHTVPKMSRVAVTAAASGLLADARTDTTTLILLARYYGHRIRVIDARRNNYAEIDPDPTNMDLSTILIRRSANGKTYAPIWNSGDAKGGVAAAAAGAAAGIPNMFKLESITKPLKAISHYTIHELRTLAAFFNIVVDTKAKKRDIYTAIWTYLGA